MRDAQYLLVGAITRCVNHHLQKQSLHVPPYAPETFLSVPKTAPATRFVNHRLQKQSLHGPPYAPETFLSIPKAALQRDLCKHPVTTIPLARSLQLSAQPDNSAR